MTSYTVIDSDKYAECGVKAFFFPGGEPHVQLLRQFDGPLLLFLKLRTWNDCGIAACLMDALNKRGTDYETFIPYFPGARQDRTDGSTPLTVDIMRAFLSRGRHSPWVFDPHSNPARWQALMPSHLGLSPELVDAFDGVIVPDVGALNRAFDFHQAFAPSSAVIECDKARDFATGRITGFAMRPLRHEGRYIIVDDICDGGATFNLLVEAFKRDPLSHGSELNLWVSHGIFSKGTHALDDKIRRIYTTDSFYRPRQAPISPRTTAFSLAPLFDKIMGVSI